MKKGLKVLYITYIDFDTPSKTGSAVRPKRMYDAFFSLGCEVMLVSGITNNRKKRKAGVLQARKWLAENTPDICYIEPPTGPLFFSCDRNLIRKIHQLKIPIGFFYRDIYWKFSERDFKGNDVSLPARLKNIMIKAMQYRDYYMLKRCVTKFYFTADSVNKYMKMNDYGVLPPGCMERQVSKIKHDGINGIYVGGATERYGMGLLLESWLRVHADGNVKLNIVCPEAQWKLWLQEHPKYKELPDNIQIYHLYDGEKLEKLYAAADFALIPILKTSYNDMALPIKLYEYISNMLPVVATNCDEMQKVIVENGIGIVGKDTVVDFSKSIHEMVQYLIEGKDYSKQIEKACKKNLWTERAAKIIDDLYGGNKL